jgi:molybdenum cofactor cytidylyltransferase
MKSFAVVILAAGSSSRFGAMKQFAMLVGKPLLCWACDSAVGSGADQVVLITPENFPIEGLGLSSQIDYVENREASSGQSSSVRAGLLAVRGEIEAMVLILGDQPLVTGSHIRALVSLLDDEVTIVGSLYSDGSTGVPVAFARAVFSKLEALTGDLGAKALITSGEFKVAVSEFGEEFDVDTPADLLHLAEIIERRSEPDDRSFHPRHGDHLKDKAPSCGFPKGAIEPPNLPRPAPPDRKGEAEYSADEIPP